MSFVIKSELLVRVHWIIEISALRLAVYSSVLYASVGCISTSGEAATARRMHRLPPITASPSLEASPQRELRVAHQSRGGRNDSLRNDDTLIWRRIPRSRLRGCIQKVYKGSCSALPFAGMPSAQNARIDIYCSQQSRLTEDPYRAAFHPARTQWQLSTPESRM